MQEKLTERMLHAAAHCEGMYDLLDEANALREGTAEIKRLRTALDVAMTTLEQIATTPRNKGARRNAYATREFLRTQLETPNAEISPPRKAG